jgi:hypothetical protein
MRTKSLLLRLQEALMNSTAMESAIPQLENHLARHAPADDFHREQINPVGDLC